MLVFDRFFCCRRLREHRPADCSGRRHLRHSAGLARGPIHHDPRVVPKGFTDKLLAQLARVQVQVTVPRHRDHLPAPLPERLRVRAAHIRPGSVRCRCTHHMPGMTCFRGRSALVLVPRLHVHLVHPGGHRAVIGFPLSAARSAGSRSERRQQHQRHYGGLRSHG
jgi:hypothetical protein